MKAILLNAIAILLISFGFYYFKLGFLATIFGLCFLIFFHELGHFLAAKSLGISVEVFSIGFGKAIYKKQISNTIYQIALIPFGGYVKIKGQEDENNKQKGSFANLNPFGKIYILLAGPVFNFIIAFVFYVFIAFIGKEVLEPKIGQIALNSPAQNILLKDDEIISINGEKITSWEQISKNLTQKNANVTIIRNNQTLNFDIRLNMNETYDEFDRKISKYMLGISPKGTFKEIKYTGLDAFSFAFNETLKASKLIIKAVYFMINGEISYENLGGMVMLSDITARSISLGFGVYLMVLAAISVNLGIMNLLPIPPLDGGHIFMNLYEIILRHKAPKKLYTSLNIIGLILLLTMMIVANTNDIFRYFF